MTTKLLLCLVSVLFLLGVNAQTPNEHNESAGIKSRRSDVNFERWNGTAWDNVDSAHYTYLGTRGNDFSSDIYPALNFDFNRRWRWVNGNWENKT